nr:immunoglobulin light chain junction region [Macaca mulatta]MOY17479.1 immunoglobulin light chain junction region [Macaca mulatta]
DYYCQVWDSTNYHGLF